MMRLTELLKVLPLALAAILAGSVIFAANHTGTPVIPDGPEPEPVEIIVYSDLQCPICYRFYSEIEGEILTHYVMTGKASIEIRLIATVGPESSLAAQAAFCAGEQGQFWQYYDAVLAEWSQDGQAAYVQERLQDVAADLGIDVETFNACLASGRWQQVIEDNQVAADREGINLLPTVVINGIKIEELQPLEEYVNVIEDQLAGQPPAQS